MSFSLHTDSDCSDSSDLLYQPYPSNHHSSFSVQDDCSHCQESIIENDEILASDLVQNVNLTLKREMINSVMNYKCASRALLCTTKSSKNSSFSDKLACTRMELLTTKIDTVIETATSNSRKHNKLVRSLKDLRHLKKIHEINKNKLEENIQKLEMADKERTSLALKLNEVSKSLALIASSRETKIYGYCRCVIT